MIMIHRSSSLILPCFLFSCLVLSTQPLAYVTFVVNCVCSLWRAFVACAARSHRPVFRRAFLQPARLGAAWIGLGVLAQPRTVWLDSVRFRLAARILFRLRSLSNRSQVSGSVMLRDCLCVLVSAPTCNVVFLLRFMKWEA